MKLDVLAIIGLIGGMACSLHGQVAVDRGDIAGRPVLKGQKIVPHPNQVYHGLYNIADVPEGYAEMTTKSHGETPGVVLFFHDWNASGIESEVVDLQTFNDPMEGDTQTVLEFAEAVSADGAVLAVVWDPITYLVEHSEFDYMPGGPNSPIKFSDLFDGLYDEYIRQCAHQIKAFGKPIMLSVTGEYNAVGFVSFGPGGNEYVLNVENDNLTSFYGDPMVPDGPERVRDLYRYVIDIFNEELVENVTWFMYSHTAYMNPDDFEEADASVLSALHPRHYYPGDEYIDWLGNSAYVSNDNPVRNLDYEIGSVISAFIDMGVNKPWFLTEFGVTELGTDSRATRMAELLFKELPSYPMIKMMTFADAPLFELYFDIPDLGSGAWELDVWNAAIHKLGIYSNGVRFK